MGSGLHLIKERDQQAEAGKAGQLSGENDGHSLGKSDTRSVVGMSGSLPWHTHPDPGSPTLSTQGPIVAKRVEFHASMDPQPPAPVSVRTWGSGNPEQKTAVGWYVGELEFPGRLLT